MVVSQNQLRGSIGFSAVGGDSTARHRARTYRGVLASPGVRAKRTAWGTAGKWLSLRHSCKVRDRSLPVSMRETPSAHPREPRPTPLWSRIGPAPTDESGTVRHSGGSGHPGGWTFSSAGCIRPSTGDRALDAHGQ
jgi:hypothetical protein